MKRFYIISGTLFCAISILINAMGAHLLKDSLTSYELSLLETSSTMLFSHGVGLLIHQILCHIHICKSSIPSLLFAIGTLIFSGSLVLIIISKQTFFGMLTPFGGIAVILGWLYIAIDTFKTFHYEQKN